MRLWFLALLFLAIACGPTAAGPLPSPSISATPQPTASASPIPSPSPSPLARIAVSDAPITGSGGKLLLFQAANETRLRAIAWDAAVSGTLPGSVPPGTAWSQAPYGSPYLAGSMIFDRDGHSLGLVPWPARVMPTWSVEGTSLCAAVSESDAQGASMRLERLTFGQPARVIATGFTTYSNNAGYPVLACDTGNDRAIVAVFGQGIAPAKLWIFRLSTGAIIRAVDYGGSGWVAASMDGAMLAETVTTQARSTTTIRRADDGSQLATIDDFVGRGFSGDGTLIVGMAGANNVALVDWKSGRRVWSSGGGPYGGFFPEAAGAHMAIGVGFIGGSDVRDVYIVSAEGSAVLLPAGVRVAMRY
jgi:hypothetical protein